MKSIKAYPMQNSAILRINSEKEFIDIDPWYQRQGDVWTLEKKQLLIDSILNEFDIPKLYFHVLTQSDSDYDYAVIDGRQRLESIWDYMNDGFPLSTEFEYFKSPQIDARGLRYSDLASKYPKLKIRFDSFSLPIICVETDDIDLIEDMFSRLNEAVPLNAAEKRNSIGGPMAQAIREVALNDFFKKKVKFGNNRYQHREVAAKLLFLEYSLRFRKKIIDTKKPYLDDMVKRYKKGTAEKIDEIKNTTINTLERLNKIFNTNDELLRAQTVVPIFYLAMKKAVKNKTTERFTRADIVRFFISLSDNRKIAQENIAEANFDLLEFDRMTQQGTNDSVSIDQRVRIICKYLRIENFIDFLKGFDYERQCELISSLIEEEIQFIDSEDPVASLIAETNAFNFYVDDFSIEKITFEDDSLVNVSFLFHMTGENDADKPYCGDEINGTGLAIVDSEKNIDIDILSGEVDREYD